MSRAYRRDDAGMAAIAPREPPGDAERRIAMGRNTPVTTIRRAAAVATIAVAGFAGCAGGDDDDDASSATAPAATIDASEPRAGAGTEAAADEADEAGGAPPPESPDADVANLQVAGQAIAIEASATMQA